MDYPGYVGDELFFGSHNESENCTTSSSAQQVRSIMVIIRGSVGSLSLVTCVFAIALLFCSLRLLKRFTYRLALYLVVSAMFYSIVAVFAFENMRYNPLSSIDVRFCKAAGFLLQYSDWIKLILTTITTFHLFLLMVFHFDLQKLCGLKLEIGYIIFSIIFPLTFIWYPFFNDTYGQAGAWCWIRTMDDNCETIDAGKIEQMAVWYGPFSVLLLINTLVIVIIIGVLVSRTVRDRYKKSFPSDPAHTPLLRFGPTSVNDYNNNTTNEQQKQLLKLSLPLLAYPIVYQILSFFAFADRLYRIVNNNQPQLGLWYAHAFASASRGFFAGVTLIIHLCLVKPKRSSYGVRYPPTPQQRSTAEPQGAIEGKNPVTSDGNKTRNAQGSQGSGLTGRRSVPTKDNAPSLAAVSEGGHTTRFQVPPESEVDKEALEPSALHHGDSSEVLVQVGDEGPTRRMYLKEDEVGSAQVGRAGDTAINTTATSRQLGELEDLENELDERGYATSDTAVTSDEEVTRYKPPQESEIDKATLLANKPEVLLDKSDPVTNATSDKETRRYEPLQEDEEDNATRQLDKVESLLDEEGYATSDTGVTSDEEVTSFKYPRESEVDKRVLHGKS